MFGNFDWLNLNHLIPMEYVYIFIGMIIIYLILRPFVNWVVSVQSVKLLNYVVSSLVFLVVFLLVFVLASIADLQLFEILLQCLAIFGGCLILIHTIQYMLRKNKKRA
ncbi:hypothetical protein [Virgibacillus doumboii]|uniref:hypothetical protein n=1 Tax=Virgibacillus doumboii TaxID=2697503 RepID=UPI0013DFE14D|nr:hypothetical protein [Virgibacillus doumboii]